MSMVGRGRLWESDLAANKLVGVVSFCVVAVSVYFFRLFPPLTLFANSRNFEAQLFCAQLIPLLLLWLLLHVLTSLDITHTQDEDEGNNETARIFQ